MSWQDQIRGFYAIIDRIDDDLASALLAAAGVLQVRVKGNSQRLLEVARWAQRVSREAGALFVVNDSLAVARELGADALHLGQDDVPLERARAELGDSMLIGVSTHNPAQVEAAVAGGADYLGYGPVFTTGTKENPDPVQGVDALARAVELAGTIPVVAIGGITPARAGACAAAGASAVCAIASVTNAADPRAAAMRMADGFAGR
jgi:thiamine-phosphate pyrophosphorylase